MATIVNITNKIKNEEKFIVIGEKKYKVDDRKNTVTEILAIAQMIEESDAGQIELIDSCLEKLLGKEALKDFESMNFEDYAVVFETVIAVATGEKAEKRFQ